MNDKNKQYFKDIATPIAMLSHIPMCNDNWAKRVIKAMARCCIRLESGILCTIIQSIRNGFVIIYNIGFDIRHRND